jgi:hypothetical protein
VEDARDKALMRLDCVAEGVTYIAQKMLSAELRN